MIQNVTYLKSTERNYKLSIFEFFVKSTSLSFLDLVTDLFDARQCPDNSCSCANTFSQFFVPTVIIMWLIFTAGRVT